MKKLFCPLYRPISGASMNPARTLGPAIASASYKGIWIYFVGPVIGAILGAVSYDVIRDKEKQALETSPSSLSFKLCQSSATDQV